MPLYQYADTQGHTQEVAHRMQYTTGIVCDCGLPMHRVPQAIRINWQGARAVDSRPDDVEALLKADQGRRREEYAELKDSHKKYGVTKFKRPL